MDLNYIRNELIKIKEVVSNLETLVDQKIRNQPKEKRRNLEWDLSKPRKVLHGEELLKAETWTLTDEEVIERNELLCQRWDIKTKN